MDEFPIIIKLITPKKSIFDTKPTVTFSSSIDYPKSEYGFHHFIHQTKDKTEILQKYAKTKKPYLIFSKFESTIDGYKNDINNSANKFFGQEIISRSFYKLWEILSLFNIIDLKSDKFISVHLAEDNNSFVQAVLLFREKFTKKGLSNSDKYFPYKLFSLKNTSKFENDFNVKYSKKIVLSGGKKTDKKTKIKSKPKIESDTESDIETDTESDEKSDEESDTESDKESDTKLKTYEYKKEKLTENNITNIEIIKKINKEVKNEAQLITADGGFEWINENIQEQEAFRLIISEVAIAIKIQKKGGNFVCKFFEIFTNTTMKIISILTSVYETVYIIKPLTSRQSNSERYVVCLNYKFDEKNKQYKNIMDKIDELIGKINKNTSDFIVDIFEEYELDETNTKLITKMNIDIANNQYENINKMIKYIKNERFLGTETTEQQNIQIECSKYWTDIFLNDDLQEDKHKKLMKHFTK
jgi:23S rRNA U2552 (ribose-2'-O)-methylase RlmE/FtsJ